MNKKTLLDNMAMACDKVFKEEEELNNAIIFFESTIPSYPINEKVKMIYNSLSKKKSLKEIENNLRDYQRNI
jgi:hypothetical protein